MGGVTGICENPKPRTQNLNRKRMLSQWGERERERSQFTNQHEIKFNKSYKTLEQEKWGNRGRERN